jgi:putative beta-barrel porin
MRQFFIQIFLALFLFGAANAAFAQGRFGGGLGSAFSGGGGGGGLGPVVLDTSEIHFFFADSPNEVYPFSDSLLETLHQYDPIRQQEYNYAHLGNLGSAARPLFYQPAMRRGFDVGLHQFDIYQMSAADVRYYHVTQAFTQATYTQGPTQTDAQLNVRFSRNFAGGLNLTLEHRRINNGGAYDFQRANNSSVAAGLRYHNKDGRYDGYFSFVTNSVQQENNGGIAESLTDSLIPPFQVLVNLKTSNTRHARKELAYTQYFYLNKMTKEERQKRRTERIEEKAQKAVEAVKTKPILPDSSAAPLKTPKPEIRNPKPETSQPPPLPKGTGTSNLNRSFTLYHQIAWRTGSFKFSDTEPDSAFYGPFLVDSRGLRHFLKTQTLENTFKLQTFKLRQDGTQARERDLLEAGLVNSLHLIDQEPLSRRTQNDLFLTGRLNFSPGERMQLQSYAHLGIGADAGDFRLSGELFLDFKNIGSLRLEAVNQLYAPSLLDQQFYVTEQALWENDFQKTLETSLSATYALPVRRFSATGQYHLVSNLVYFDTAGLPRQSGAFSVLQLVLRKDFQSGGWHLENWAGLQKITSYVLALPQLYSRHSLYWQGRVFRKVMLAKLGLDARLTTNYDAPAYQPLTGRFYLQEEQTLPFTPLLDGFVSFQVKTFRFFFKIENLLTFPNKEYYFQTTGYPLPFGFNNGGIRFGISWRLVD